MTDGARPKVLNPTLGKQETVLVLSKAYDSIGVLLDKTLLSARRLVESDLQVYANTVRTKLTTKTEALKRGDYVLTLSEFSEPTWCRSLILEVKDSLLQVEQIDYGYLETVHIEKLLRLPFEFTAEAAFSVRLQVEPSQYNIGEKYHVLIGDFIDDLQRTVEATLISATSCLPPSDNQDHSQTVTTERLVIPEDLGDVEQGFVIDFIYREKDDSKIYGVQHRTGFDEMAQRLAEVHLEPIGSIQQGDFVVVRFYDMLCRALVVEMHSSSAKVFHVDFGSWDTVSFSDMFCVQAGVIVETPQMAFQCIIETKKDLKLNENLMFEINSVLHDAPYPVYVCEQVDGPSKHVYAFKKEELAKLNLQPREKVILAEKLLLNGATFGAMILERFAHNDDLEHQLERSFFNSNAMTRYTPQRDDVCISYLNGIFYRSIVCDVNAENCLVFQIDIGSFRNCSKTVLVPLPEQYLIHPPMGVACRLKGIYQTSMPVMTAFEVEKLVDAGCDFGIDTYTFQIAFDGSAAQGNHVTKKNSSLSHSSAGTSSKQFGEPESKSFWQTENPTGSATDDGQAALLHRKKLQQHRFPVFRFGEETLSYIDVKIISVKLSDGFVTLSIVLLDKQQLIEESLKFIDRKELKPLYSSDALSKAPGLMRLNNSWARVVICDRPSPNTYAVQLVDYGVVRMCSVDDVFCCPRHFVQVEMCTVDCDVEIHGSNPENIHSLVGKVVVLFKSVPIGFQVFSRETGQRIVL